MNRKGLKVVGLLVALLLVAVTACGGGDKKEESSGSVSATAPDSGSSDDDSSSGTGSDGNSLQDLDDAIDALADGDAGDCLSAGMAFFALALVPLGFMGGATDADIEKLENDLRDLEADIPSEIRDEFETYSAGMQEYANAMKGVNFEDIMDPAVQAQMEEASKILESPEMEEANQAIERYFDEVCPS